MDMEKNTGESGREESRLGTLLIIGAAVLLVLITLILRHVHRDEDSRTFSSESYRSLEMAGDTCYLTDKGGVAYTLDLATGERTFCFQGPADVSWTADDTMEHLYYVEDKILREMETATGKTRDLLDMTADASVQAMADYEIMDKEVSWEVLGVSEHYVMFDMKTTYGENYHYDVYALNLETLEISSVLLEEDGETGGPAVAMWANERMGGPVVFLGDTVFTALWYSTRLHGEEETQTLALSAIDLAQGTVDQLAILGYDSDYTVPAAIAVTKDKQLLYVLMGQEEIYELSPDTGKSVLLTKLPIETHAATIDWFDAMSKDGTLLTTIDIEVNETKLYHMDVSTGAISEVTRFADSFNLHTLVTDGEHYGIMGYLNGKMLVILGDLP